MWSLPQTWATGMILSASGTSGFNTQIRDQLLSARNGWGAGIKLSLAGDQSVSNNTVDPVTWDLLDWSFDPTATLWASASGSKLLAPDGGRYELGGSLEFRSNASGYRAAGYRLNGTSAYQTHTMQNEVTDHTINVPITGIVLMTTADYLEITAFQNTGAALNLHGQHPDQTHVTWRFLGGAS